MKRTLNSYYTLMHRHFGTTHWWPGDSPFEVAAGAILTQNTAWTNVEKAIKNLKAEKLLSPKAILACPIPRLETQLRPSGFFRLKTRRLRNFCQFLVQNHGGSMKRMARLPTDTLRRDLLNLNGIGPETADDILLYACEKPVFVVDAYTRRIFSRHAMVPADIEYEDLQTFFHRYLEADVDFFGEYHGLIVWTGKHFCKKKPDCQGCPLAVKLGAGQPVL